MCHAAGRTVWAARHAPRRRRFSASSRVGDDRVRERCHLGTPQKPHTARLTVPIGREGSDSRTAGLRRTRPSRTASSGAMPRSAVRLDVCRVDVRLRWSVPAGVSVTASSASRGRTCAGATSPRRTRISGRSGFSGDVVRDARKPGRGASRTRGDGRAVAGRAAPSCRMGGGPPAHAPASSPDARRDAAPACAHEPVDRALHESCDVPPAEPRAAPPAEGGAAARGSRSGWNRLCRAAGRPCHDVRGHDSASGTDASVPGVAGTLGERDGGGP